MPRVARIAPGGLCFHVINRGNMRVRVFHDDADYRDFLKLLAAACERVELRLLAYCLMPNHFHLVAWPRQDGDLGRAMQWLMTSQVRRHHKRHGTEGHLWQGRYKSFAIQNDGHLLTVLRYVEQNPLRAKLVKRAEGWPWSSASTGPPSVALDPGPLPRPADWLAQVNDWNDPEQLAALRRSVDRGLPWGAAPWIAQTATRLGLDSLLRPVGRPRKPPGQTIKGITEK